MRPALLIAVGAGAATVAAIWAAGGFAALAAFAADGQRAVQNDMGGALRALKAGETGALLALLAITFAYGVFHAAGPGHGKVLIGGYALGRRVAPLRITAIALAASLAQSLTAIALVYAGVAVFDWTRERMEGAVEHWFAPASYAAIGLIGAWLVWRGLASARHSHAHGHHDHGHADGHACHHAHGADPKALLAAERPRDVALLVGSVALRPCTGALFLLVIAWRLGLDLAGILGTIAMGLGTASVTAAVALAATGAREGLIAGLADSPAARIALPALELTAGAVILAGAATLLVPYL